MKRIVLYLIFTLLYYSVIKAQAEAGIYTGSFNGDLSGSFQFTIDYNYYNNLEGTFMINGQPAKLIVGRVEKDGQLQAALFDNQNYVNTGLSQGRLQGFLQNGKGSGTFEVYDATAQKTNTSKGSWTTQMGKSGKPKGPPLSYSFINGKDLPFNEDQPIALRFHFTLNESWRKNYTIQHIELGARNPEAGRFSPDIDYLDNFYVYTTVDGVRITPAPNSPEADFNFEYAHFGNKEKILLPKTIRAVFYVTLLNKETGETQKEKLETIATIQALASILVKQCYLGECPSLNGKKINKGNTVNVVPGDQLKIPLKAELWVKFLDGTIGYFTNKSQTPWSLTMRGGHWGSDQQWEYTENAISIQAIAAKGLEKGSDEISDKALEAGLQLLLKKSSNASPGLIVQLMEFIGANKAGGDLLAIKLRSKVEISLYQNGTYRIRNYEGSPEIWQKNSKPLLLPAGRQVLIDRKGLASQPVTFTGNLPTAEKTISSNWAGTWQTPWGKLILVQSGNQMTGTYEHDKGKITGMINGNIISGNWSEAASYQPPNDAGEFEFVLSADGQSFTGRWRYGNKGSWQKGWDGHR